MTVHDTRPTLGAPPDRFAEYAVEAKFDGQRGIAIVDGGRARLLSRNGADVTATFPEITAALPAAVGGRDVRLDGEIVALDDTGAPSFGRLQQRWPQNRRPSAELLRRVPVRFFAFDALHRDGDDLTRHPYTARRAALLDLVGDTGSTVRCPGSWPGVDPNDVLAAAAELGLEGIVTKRLDSVYTPGVRSRDWIKTPLRRRAQFVVGGWLPGSGARHGGVATLLVGAYDGRGRLRFCGGVGAGIAAVERRRLTPVLESLARETSPFASVHPAFAAHARWVRPELVGDVEYREFDRGLLRHPSWKGLRPDLGRAEAVLPAA